MRKFPSFLFTKTYFKMEDEIIVVTAMVAAQILHQTLDELEETPYYKRKLKQVTKTFQDTITKECDSLIKRLYDVDEVTVNNLQDDIILIAKSIATMNPTDMILIRSFIENINKEK